MIMFVCSNIKGKLVGLRMPSSTTAANVNEPYRERGGGRGLQTSEYELFVYKLKKKKVKREPRMVQERGERKIFLAANQESS